MHIKLETLLNSFNELKEFIAIPLDASVAFKLIKLLNEVESICTNFEKIRFNKIKEYGFQNDNGDWEVKSENIDHFKDEIEKLLAENVDLPNITIFIDDLKNISLKPAVLMRLSWLIKESMDG